jgi:hypothetical protein
MLQQPDQRWHGLDAVRGLALTAGVVLHGAMAFLPGPQMWLVKDATESTTLSVAFFTIHMARMTVFFVLAGFFGRLVFHRAGPLRFVRNRAMRIALPLVLAWPLVWFAILMVIAAATPGGDSGIPALTAGTFPLTHLWFLYLLLWLYTGALLVRALVVLVDRGGQVRRASDSAMRALLWPWAPALLAIPVTWALYQHGYWFMWFGIPTPDTGLLPSRVALITYGLAFGLGWLMHRQAAILLPRLQRQWPIHLGLALAATVFCLATTSATPLLAPAPFGAAKLQFATAYAVGLWSWALALLGLGLRFLGNPSPARRYLADASYWIYIVHLPLVAALQLLIRDWPLPWPVKFAVLITAAMTVLLLAYHWLVRPTWIGALLNGRRYPRRASSHTQGTTLMKSLPMLMLLPALLHAQAVVAPAPLPLETVISRHISAMGPVQQFQTRRVSMRVNGMAPFEIPVVAEAMRPNLLLKQVTIQGAVQLTGYDGRSAWRVDPFASSSKKGVDVPEAELMDFLEETDFDGPMVNAAAKGNRLRYVGPRVVSVAGRPTPVHAVELTQANGRQAVVHIHATTYLEVLRTQSRDVMGTDMAMTITPSDFRTAQGITTPFLMEIAVEGLPAPIRLQIDQVEFGVALNRTQFSRP